MLQQHELQICRWYSIYNNGQTVLLIPARQAANNPYFRKIFIKKIYENFRNNNNVQREYWFMSKVI